MCCFKVLSVSKATHQSITLFKRAETNPTMLKLSSVAVHSERPAIMGTRERFTNRLELSPETQHEKMREQGQGYLCFCHTFLKHIYYSSKNFNR